MSKEVTGLMIYYYKVCTRKLWYFCRGIEMEHNSENVAIGKIIDENSYKREDKHINIDNVINVDFIKNKKILHEVKKSRSIEEASILQVKYYLYFFKKRGVDDLTAKIDYPLLKQSVNIELSEEDIFEIEEIINEIKSIIHKDIPPVLKKQGICKNCAYYNLCFI